MIFLSSSITQLPLSSILAAVILLLFCVPICFIIYLSDNQIISKKLFLSLSISYFLLAMSGIIWYLLPDIFHLDYFIPVGQLVMLLSYFPMMIALFFVYNEQKYKLHKIIKTFIYYTLAAFFIMLIFFDIGNLLGGGDAFDIFIYSSSILLDVIIICLSIMLILINMPTQLRYLFFIIFGENALSFMGDIFNLLQYFHLYESNISPEYFYDVELLFLAGALLIYALSNIKITTIEEVNKKLKDTSLVVEDLINQSPDPMCMCDVNGNVLKANDDFNKVFYIDGENINIFNLNIDKSILSSLVKVKSGQTIHINSIEIKNPSGEIRYLSIKMYPTLSSDKKISNLIFLAEDITNRKRAEDALKVAYDEMENRVKERTKELSGLNDALNKEIIEHKKDEEKIKASLKEKDVLLKEVHHRVKNNMQIISSMLGLQSNYVNDQFVNNILLDSQNRIKSMALIHEKLYQSDNMASINISDYVSSLMLNLSSSYSSINERVSFKTNIENISLNLNTAIPLGLIINELITNSIKHAFPNDKKGEIFIELKGVNTNECELVIKDNGIGLPIEFDINTTKTLGLQLVKVLVEQIDGRLEIINNSGATFNITFTC